MNFQFKKIDVVESINESWRIFKQNLGMALVGWLLAGVANFAIAIAIWFVGTFVQYFFMFLIMIPVGIMGGKGGDTETVVGAIMMGLMVVVMVGFRVLLQILQIALTMFVNAGLLTFYIKFAKIEKAPDLKSLIVFDKRVWHLFLFQMLLTLIVFLIIFICLVPGVICLGFGLAEKISFIPAIVFGSIGGVVLLVAIIYLQLVLAQAPYFIIDKRVGPIDAATLSLTAMKDNKFSLFAIWFLMAMVGGGVVIGTCGIGIILVGPFFLLLYAKVYVNVVGEEFIPEQLEIEHDQRYI